MNNKILGAYNPACLLSLAGVVAAAVAMALAVNGDIELALIGLIFAGLADLFDGPLARRLQRGEFEKEFGVQLDTTVDVVAFVATPVVIALSAVSLSWFVVASIACFVVAGVVRLAHFNTLVVRNAGSSAHHRGLPVTYVALIFPLLYLPWGYLTAEVFSLLISSSLIIIAVLFMINVPVRKPARAFYLILPLLAVGLVVLWSVRYFQSAGMV